MDPVDWLLLVSLVGFLCPQERRRAVFPVGMARVPVVLILIAVILAAEAPLLGARDLEAAACLSQCASLYPLGKHVELLGRKSDDRSWQVSPSPASFGLLHP